MRSFYLQFSAAGMLAFALSACQTQTPEDMSKYAAEAHSFARPNEIAVTHLHLELGVDFENKVLTGKATYTLNRQSGNTLVLDVRDITIDGASAPDGSVLTHRLVKGNERGDRLEIDLPEGLTEASVSYRTAPTAAALFWTPAEQTLDGTAPFLFTQGQAILTRTWIPIQDSPAVRFTYSAKVKTPNGMIALMSAVNPTAMNDASVYEFNQPNPIPAYLMALAVGNLSFKAVGERTGVYSEPGMIEKSAYEFADMEKMLLAAEALYGPYAWGRYDVLVLPPSFPFGGMENPVLTFATPTIIVGDRSLTSLVAHELAHSWSGNLVTNATWNDFWLNEGFTVYFENRIMEAVYGPDYADMLAVLGYQELLGTIESLGAENPDTHLKLSLDNRDPDDGMNDIAYEKGRLFLIWLESLTGREAFDKFLKEYFASNAFQTMTTEDFIIYLDKNLLDSLSARPDVESWIYKPGLPANHPVPVSTLFQKVDTVRMQWEGRQITAAEMQTSAWSTHEWLHLLRGLDDSLSIDKLTELDTAHGLTNTANSEIAAAWFNIAIRCDYKPAFPALEAFLMRVGRRKFVKPLFEALMADEANALWAKEVYVKARPRYHAVTVQTLDAILKYKQ
jgi:aminopeptidase N